jgi:Mn2+/Fe2+ NRAMP family transporter
MVFSMSLRDMGKFVLPLWLQILGWIATAVMAAAAVVMFATWGR